MKLTDEQRKFAEENHNLIYWFLQKKGLPVDDWYGVAAVGFVKAVATFDSGKSKFATYAYRCMNNSVNMERRNKEIPCLSLNETYPGEDGCTVELQDFIPDEFDYAVDVEPFIDALSCLNTLPERTRQILLMKHMGHSEKEIAERFSVSKANASRIVHRAREKLRNKYTDSI